MFRPQMILREYLLFTTNLKIAENCQHCDLEIIDQEITFDIHDIGFSLVNNITKSELLYMYPGKTTVF